MSQEIAVQQPTFVKASTSLSQFLGVEPGMMIETIKRQCFRGMNADAVSDAQLAAFVSVANGLKMNPLLPGFLYAYPERNGGITPIIGPDGMYKMLAEHPEVDSWETNVYPEDVTLPATHSTTKIYRKGREKPISYTAIMSEWRVSSNPNWQSRPRHMIGIRSLKQAARQIVHGLPWDEDEKRIAEMTNVTGTGEGETAVEQIKRTPPPKRSEKGVAAIKENAAPAPTPEPEKPAEQPATEVVATETPKAEEKPAFTEAEIVQDKPKEKRTLKLDEVGSFPACKVNACKATAKGSMLAELDGGFYGDVFHQQAASNPLWKDGALLTVSLQGKADKSGKVVNFVTSIKETPSDDFN